MNNKKLKDRRLYAKRIIVTGLILLIVLLIIVVVLHYTKKAIGEPAFSEIVQVNQLDDTSSQLVLDNGDVLNLNQDTVNDTNVQNFEKGDVVSYSKHDKQFEIERVINKDDIPPNQKVGENQ